MAYQMSLLDVETGDTFDLQLSIINEGAIITQGYVPPSPSVSAQTLQPHSPTAMPGRHEATRSYLTESMPLVIQGRDTEQVQEIARDLEWFCERANVGKEVYLRRVDLVTSSQTLRSRILVGELALDQGSEFQLHAGHPRVQFRLQLTRDAWWEGAEVRLRLASSNSGNGSNTLSVSSRGRAFIRTTVPGVLATPLEMRWQRLSSTVNQPAMLSSMLLDPPTTTVANSITVASSSFTVGTTITDGPKSTGQTYTPGKAEWYRVIAAPATSSALAADSTLHDSAMIRAVGGFISIGDEDWLGEWSAFGKLFGQSQRYTDLGTLYIARTMHFFIQGVSNTGASVTLPPIDLVFIPTHSFRSWTACQITAGQEMVDVQNPYIDAGSSVVLPLESVDGEQLTVHPGGGHQIDVIFQDRSAGSESGQYRLSAYCRPRYLTI